MSTPRPVDTMGAIRQAFTTPAEGPDGDTELVGSDRLPAAPTRGGRSSHNASARASYSRQAARRSDEGRQVVLTMPARGLRTRDFTLTVYCAQCGHTAEILPGPEPATGG